ncbi:MAG: AAA family ATPase [Acidimicrobiales bacterium]
MWDQYLPRVVEGELDELLPAPPHSRSRAPRGVGKTCTARRRALTVHALDAPGALELFEADPRRLIDGDPAVLLDEWQHVPTSWDLVRRAVDDDPSPGRFLLTGSAAPAGGGTHSGAGRIVRLRTRLSRTQRRSHVGDPFGCGAV